jgi:hypothetical protein
MRNGRVWAAALVSALSLGFVALLTRAAYEGLELGTVAQATLSMLIVTGFLIVAAVAVIASQGRVAALGVERCRSCGSPLYATIRSLDRRRLLTCFSCGHETVAA